MEDPVLVNESEFKARSLFKSHFGISTKKTKTFSRFDAICNISKVLLEVKNRSCYVNTYPTSIFPKNKIDYWKKHYPDYSLFFVCCYKDGEYYYEFKEDDNIEVALGGRTDRGKPEIKDYLYIPISLFKKFD